MSPFRISLADDRGRPAAQGPLPNPVLRAKSPASPHEMGVCSYLFASGTLLFLRFRREARVGRSVAAFGLLRAANVFVDGVNQRLAAFAREGGNFVN